MALEDDKHVRLSKLKEGPLGLGDPDDLSLRKVEIEVLIPKLMRDKAKKEHCSKEVAAFTSCCKENSILMVINCRRDNDQMKECLSKWYQNESFKDECKNEYLKQRSEYRRTGLLKKHRDFMNSNS